MSTMTDALLVDPNRKFTVHEIMRRDTSGTLKIPVNHSKFSNPTDITSALQVLLAIPDNVFGALHDATLTTATPGLPTQEERQVRCRTAFNASTDFQRICVYIVYLVDKDWHPPTVGDYEVIVAALEHYAATLKGSEAQKRAYHAEYVAPIDNFQEKKILDWQAENKRGGGMLKRYGKRDALPHIKRLAKDLREEIQGYRSDERLPRPLNYVGWTSGLGTRMIWADQHSGSPVKSLVDIICRMAFDGRYTMRTIRVFDQFDNYQAELAEHIVMHAAGGYGRRSMSVEAAGGGTSGERVRPQTYWEQLQAEVMASPTWISQTARQEAIDGRQQQIAQLRINIAEFEVQLALMRERLHARTNDTEDYRRAMQRRIDALKQAIEERRSWRMMLVMARLVENPYLDTVLTDVATTDFGTSDAEMTDMEGN